MKTSGAEWAISALVGILLLGVLVVGITFAGPEERKALKQVQAANAPYSSVLGQGFLGVGVGPAHDEVAGGTKQTVRVNYLLPFEIVSVHLLVVLIGAAYLARAKRRRSVAS
jgi:NADH-quinone oxidoreductase subunit J